MRVAFLAAALVVAAPAFAAPQFKTLDTALPTSVAAGQVEVLEFFSWGCPACNAAEPEVQRFLATKPANVVFRRVPATFEPVFAKLAPVYYVAELLGVVEKVSGPMYAAMHDRSKPSPVRDAVLAFRRAEITRGEIEPARQAYEAAVAQLFQQHAGIAPDKFRATWYSPALRVKLAESESLYRAWQVGSVPSFAVGGRYLATASEELGIHTIEDVTVAMRAAVAEATKPRR
jgi:thiol:disulfide interchange protein DsbA